MEAFSSLIPIAVAIAGGGGHPPGEHAPVRPGGVHDVRQLFTAPIQSLVNTSRLIQEGRTAFHRYTELLETKPQIQDAPGAKELPRVQGKVEFRDVSFRYQGGGHGAAPSEPDHPGRGVRGPGGGLRGGEDHPCVPCSPGSTSRRRGRSCWTGVPIQSVTLSSLRRNIGSVQQDVYLFTGTVAENIAYGRPGASLEEIQAAARRAGAHQFH